MKDYASRQRAPRKHLVGFALVVLLHALIFWAINSGLSHQFVKVLNGPVEAQLIAETKPELPPPTPPPPSPPPPKNLPPPPAYVPPVDVPVSAVPAPSAAIAAVSTTPPASAPAMAAPIPLPPAPLVRMPATINVAGNCQRPEYPGVSRRMEEEGTVQLRILVGVDGQVVRAEVEKSSGYGRLDEAARAALSKCQFKPGTVDGKPEQSWASMKYIWRLE